MSISPPTVTPAVEILITADSRWRSPAGVDPDVDLGRLDRELVQRFLNGRRLDATVGLSRLSPAAIAFLVIITW